MRHLAEPGKEQRITVDILFTVKHTPGNEAHLHQIAKSYLRGKGVKLEDNKISI